MIHSPETARRAVNTIFLVNGTIFATWAVNIPGVRDRLGLNEAQIGVALLAAGIGALVTMSVVGGWTARWGSARVTAISTVLFLLSLLLPFVAPNLGGLVAALAVLGAANGVMDVAMNAQGVTVEQRLGRPVMSRFHAYFSLGSLLGAGLGTLLVGRLPMLGHAALVTALTLAAGFWAIRRQLPDAPAPAPQTDGSGARTFGLAPAAAFLGALCFLGMLAEGANYDWSALYFRDELGQEAGRAGLGYAAFVAAMTLGRWFGDRVRTRLGDEATVRGGAAVTALGIGLALLVRDPWLAAVGFALSGLGLSNVVPVMYGAAGHALAGRGIAQVAAIGYGGFLLGPPLIGFVAEQIGLSGALLIALGGAVLIALLGGAAFALVRRAGTQVGTAGEARPT